jgi:hypothetical protein
VVRAEQQRLEDAEVDRRLRAVGRVRGVVDGAVGLLGSGRAARLGRVGVGIGGRVGGIGL